MGTITKLEMQIFGLMLALQLVLLLTAGPLATALIPPILAAVPMGYATLRSEQTVRMMGLRLPRAYISSIILSVAVAASFVFVGERLPIKLQMLRVLLADVGVLWFATAVAVHLHRRAAVRR